MRSYRYHRSAFTLIELLVVLAIIAIISTVGLVSYNGTTKRARSTKRRADLHSLHLAIEQYRAVNGSYPSTGGGWWGEPSSYGSHKTDYVPGLTPQFMRSLPNDPGANQSYPPCSDAGGTGYLYRSDGAEFKLLAHCSPEEYPAADVNAYYDPIRPTWAWQVSSDGAANW
jgi:prepilin-type N-terminal cleavage/methylation domain-containing protein